MGIDGVAVFGAHWAPVAVPPELDELLLLELLLELPKPPLELLLELPKPPLELLLELRPPELLLLELLLLELLKPPPEPEEEEELVSPPSKPGLGAGLEHALMMATPPATKAAPASRHAGRLRILADI